MSFFRGHSLDLSLTYLVQPAVSVVKQRPISARRTSGRNTTGQCIHEANAFMRPMNPPDWIYRWDGLPTRRLLSSGILGSGLILSTRARPSLAYLSPSHRFPRHISCHSSDFVDTLTKATRRQYLAPLMVVTSYTSWMFKFDTCRDITERRIETQRDDEVH